MTTKTVFPGKNDAVEIKFSSYCKPDGQASQCAGSHALKKLNGLIRGALRGDVLALRLLACRLYYERRFLSIPGATGPAFRGADASERV